MRSRRQYPGIRQPELTLSGSIGLWVLILAVIASGVWVLFGWTTLFVWIDQADRVQYSLVLAGGIGAVAALVVSYRKQKLAEANAVLDLESHFGGRFLAATEQLGSSNPIIRMAGAVSLARLADDWVTQRQMVVNVITSYLRISAPDVDVTEDEIRASLFRSIRDHLRPSASPDWQGLNFDFTNAEIAGADFTEIEMRAGTILNFTDATFSRGFVRFSGTYEGTTLAFTRSRFRGAIVEISATIGVDLLDFEGATISGGSVRMDRSTFAGNQISFQGLVIRDANLSFSGSVFNTQNIDFAGALVEGDGGFFFDHCNVLSGDVSFISARFNGRLALFAGTTFTGREIYFNGTRFAAEKTIFEGIDFAGDVVDFTGAIFFGPHVGFHKAVIHPKSLIVDDAAYVDGVVDWGRLDKMRDTFAVFPDGEALLADEYLQQESRMQYAREAFARQRQDD
ncbi:MULTISPECIES: hypothetical protein [unclassified Cryobacterium]|uniref:hypothetical protein n=1 Tax=unclassified Cryobacterium TaxID=2649013 RepID=UPI00106BE512|nr:MULTISPECIES: hypothetical protein [unclassified Cryobacterium]TFD07582.1 hypothetical protein E3T29_06760 [Cryobacterium sp. TMT1-66-1]TFD14461.1 hypothetical protein E3T35_03485 [Cryobacterium sp. TMT1-2-2]